MVCNLDKRYKALGVDDAEYALKLLNSVIVIAFCTIGKRRIPL
jgi:hypothetical protein